MKKINTGIRALCLLALVSVAASPLSAQIVAEPPFTAFPTADIADARFLAVVSGLSGLTYTPTAVGVSVAPDTTEFVFRIFDGDTGELCDVADPACSDPTMGHWDEGTTPLCATMYFDPLREGEALPQNEVGKWCSNTTLPTEGLPLDVLGGLPLWEADSHMPNNDWWNLTIRKTPEAVAPNGEAFYLVVFSLGSPDDGHTVSNFKVSATVPLSVFSANFGFEAGISPLENTLSTVYPTFSFPLPDPLSPDYYVSLPTTYDGEYNFYLDVPEDQLESLTLWDGDFDHGNRYAEGYPSGVPILPCSDDDDLNSVGVPEFALGLPDVIGEGAQGGGNPSDDHRSDLIRRDGCVTYTVTDPNGTVYRNLNPSGNQEWEKFVITTEQVGELDADYSPQYAADGVTFVSGEFLPSGLWKVEVQGLDLSNSVFWRFEQTVCGEVNGQPECPEEPVMIGDRVWYDLDKDTVGGDAVNDRDDEPGIPGIKVNRGMSQEATVTDEDGIYSFDVLPGTPADPAVYEVALAPENFAIIPTGAVGDRVWLDLNANGVDDGEPGLANVSIRLVDCSGGSMGGALAATKTGIGGYYWFDGLSSGTYCTAVDPSTLPAGVTQTGDPDGVFDGMSQTIIDVNSNPIVDTLDYGYYLADAASAAIGDRVWVDVNNNGVQDAGEPGMRGVRIDLFDCNMVFVDRTTTNGAGNYWFSELVPGCYVVEIDQASLLPGYYQVFDPDGLLDDASSASPGAGEIVVDRDFGYLNNDLTGDGNPDFCLEDVTWFDADANGLFDITDSAIAGVTLDIRGSSGDVVASLISGADGSFRVCGLGRDGYEIRITDRNGVLTELVGTTQPGLDGALTVQVPTIREIPAGSGQYFALDFAGIDFGYVNQGRLAGCQFTTPDPLAPIVGAIPFDPQTDMPDNNLTFDFGCYFDPVCLPTLDFELDAAGAALGAGHIVDDEFSDFGISITTSDPVNHPAMIFNSASPTGGDWDLGTPNETFGGPGVGSGGEDGQPGENALALGNILIISEDGDQGEPDDNAGGGVIYFDFDRPVKVSSIGIIDIDGSEAAGSVSAYDASGTLLVTAPMLPLSNNSVQRVAINAADVARLEVWFPASGGVTDVQFCVGSLGDRVWKDLSGDGIQDAGEPGIANATVRLLNGQGAELGTDVTDSNGIYGFFDLSEGLYTVVVDDSTLPSNLLQTYDLDGTLDHRTSVVLGLEEDRDDLDFGYEAGQVVCEPGDVADYFNTVSFGNNDGSLPWSGTWIEHDLAAPGPVNGGVRVVWDRLVFNDFAQTYSQPSAARQIDARMGGAVSASVSFNWTTHGGVDATDHIVFEMSTDGGASWAIVHDYTGFSGAFTDVPATFDITQFISSQSQVRFRVANGYTGDSENFKVDNLVISWICETPPVVIGDTVFRDVDGDGVQDGGDSGIPYVQVNLLSGGSLVDTAFTDDNGRYFFDVLPATWTVLVDATNFDSGGALEGLISTTGNQFTRPVVVDDLDFDFGYRGLEIVCEPGNVGDDFDTGLFSNNDGADDWFGDWIEYDTASPGPADGGIRMIWSRLVLNNFAQASSLPWAARAVSPKMGGATQATVSFKWTTHGGVDVDDSIVFEMSTDNGSSWATVHDFTGFSGAYSDVPVSYDVSAFISDQTMLRFRVGYDYDGDSENFKVDDLDVSWVCETSECVPGTVKDTFASVSYSRNDGSSDWAGDWIEVDPTREGPYDNPESGARIRTDWYGGVLVLNDMPDTSNYGVDVSVAREVDLSSADSAYLSFDWHTHDGVDLSDKIVLELSSDGGASWTLVEAFTNIQGRNSGSRSYDISAFISSRMQVRFRVAKYYGGANENFKIDNLLISWDCSSGPCRPTYYADEFNSDSFSNNDGSDNWTGDWVEDDPDLGGEGVSAGQVRVVDGALRLDDYPNTSGSPSAARKANLSGQDTATFYFEFETTSGVDTNDAIAVEVSDDGGASWTVLEVITGIHGVVSDARSYDISAFASSQTMIRFRVKTYYGGQEEYFKVGKVEITGECDDDPPVPSDSCDDGKPWQLVFEYTGESCTASSNSQTSDTCSGDAGFREPVRFEAVSPDKFLVSPGTESVALGNLVTFSSSSGDKMLGDLEFDILQGSYVKQTIKLHTSCSEPLDLGDQFGSMILRGFEAAP